LNQAFSDLKVSCEDVWKKLLFSIISEAMYSCGLLLKRIKDKDTISPYFSQV